MSKGLDLTRERAAERRAGALISELKITDSGEIDIEEIAMTQGALVVDGGLAGAEARLTRSPKLSIIRVNPMIRESGRRRFAIAHELGHMLLQRSSQLALCTSNDLVPSYTNSPDELEASVFAGALLMPAGLFDPLCRSAKPSMQLVSLLADRFRVTLTAGATRYIQFCPHRCCLVMSKSGEIWYSRPTKDFGYSLAPHRELAPSSYAADHFDGRSLPKGMHSIPANAWLEGGRIEGQTIKEESWAMPFYDSVLTLLWIDHDIDHKLSGEDEHETEEAESNRRWSWNRYTQREPDRE